MKFQYEMMLSDESMNTALKHSNYKAVLDYCEQYGSNSPSAYKELEKYKNGITDEVFNSPEDKLRAVDRLILRVFGIRN